MTPSIATKFQYVNYLFLFFPLTTCFGPYRPSSGENIQLPLYEDYSYYHGSAVRTQLDVCLRYFDPWISVTCILTYFRFQGTGRIYVWSYENLGLLMTDANLSLLFIGSILTFRALVSYYLYLLTFRYGLTGFSYTFWISLKFLFARDWSILVSYSHHSIRPTLVFAARELFLHNSFSTIRQVCTVGFSIKAIIHEKTLWKGPRSDCDVT
jgi:hypothetical protein